MKELSIVSVAPLSCPCKTVNTRAPVLVTLGVYHVKRTQAIAWLAPSLAREPHTKETTSLHRLFVPGSLWL